MRLHVTLIWLAVLVTSVSGASESKDQNWTSPEAIASGWPAVKTAAEKRDFVGAAGAAVKALRADYPDRRYAMWKWWETVFGEREDYAEMSRLFGHALFDLYDQSSETDRRIIAEIFGKPHFDIKKSGKDLRTEVEGNKE